MNNLGELFRQIRLSKNWSIREAAKTMGLSYSYLSILEKGVDPRTGKDSNPQPETLKVIAKAYGYPYEELLKAAGYITDDITPSRKFDLTLFISNIDLLMGKMNLDQFINDIREKTGHKISSLQLRSYINGDIQPYPGTMNILSKYAGVSIDFWYTFNTQETLELERKKYNERFPVPSSEELTQDYIALSNIGNDIKNWILCEESLDYIKIAMEACQKKISPSSLKLIIDTIVSERNVRINP